MPRRAAARAILLDQRIVYYRISVADLADEGEVARGVAIGKAIYGAYPLATRKLHQVGKPWYSDQPEFTVDGRFFPVIRKGKGSI